MRVRFWGTRGSIATPGPSTNHFGGNTSCVELNELPATMTYHDLTEGAHTIGGVQVFTHFLHHPTMTLGYRVEADGVAVACMTDHEPFFETRWRADAKPGRIEALLHEGDRR